MRDSTGLFINLLKRTPGHHEISIQENFLTEVIAGLLAEDPVFAREFTGLLFSGSRGRRPRQALIGVATQRSHYGRSAEPRSQIDLQLEFPKVTVGVEIKIGAPEGRTSDGKRQLAAYCGRESIDAVAMISGYLQKGDYRSLGKKYLPPPNGRGYFLWADVYPLLLQGARRRSAPVLHRAALGLFQHLSFEPHHTAVGDLDDPDPTQRVLNRERFVRYMADTNKMLKRIGAAPSPPRTNGEMFTFNLKRRAWKIWIDPRHVPGSLRLWFNLHHTTEVPRVMMALRKVQPNERITILAPAKATWPAVDVRIPYQVLFSRASKEESRGKRIAAVLAPLIEAAR